MAVTKQLVSTILLKQSGWSFMLARPASYGCTSGHPCSYD